MEVDSLYKLAYQSLAAYVCDLCSTLVECKRYMSKDLALQIAEDACGKFGRMMEALPVCVADDISSKLLTHIDMWWFFNMREVQFNAFREILQHFVRSIIHPAVTRLVPDEDRIECAGLMSICEFKTAMTVALIGSLLPTLEHLKVLNVRCMVKQDWMNFYVPKDLEEFSGYPDDELLEEVVSRSPRLKYLNLCEDSHISDSSIETILRLEDLEVLSMVHTVLSEQGTVELIEGLSKKKKLKAVSLAMEVTKGEHILRHKLPHVTLNLSVISFYSESNFSFLLQLENLRGLYIAGPEKVYRQIVPHIGSRLIILYVDSLNFNKTEDLRQMLDVGKVLMNLRCFHLSFNTYFRDLGELYHFDYPQMSGFSSVRCLQIMSNSRPNPDFGKWKVLERLLKQCTSIQALTVDFNYCLCNSPACLEDLFRLHPSVLNTLVEFCWLKWDNFSRCNDDRVIELLIQRCPKLRVIEGLSRYTKTNLPNMHMIRLLQ